MAKSRTTATRTRGGAVPPPQVLVLEYLPGGELLDHLPTLRHYSEAEAAKLFAQLAAAVWASASALSELCESSAMGERVPLSDMPAFFAAYICG